MWQKISGDWSRVPPSRTHVIIFSPAHISFLVRWRKVPSPRAPVFWPPGAEHRSPAALFAAQYSTVVLANRLPQDGTRNPPARSIPVRRHRVGVEGCHMPHFPGGGAWGFCMSQKGSLCKSGGGYSPNSRSLARGVGGCSWR